MSAPLVKTKYPGVYRRGGVYVFGWYDSIGKERRRSAPTIESALIKRAEEIEKARRGARVSDRAITFAEYASEWIGTYTGRTSKGIGPDTLSDYRKTLGLDADGNPLGRMVGAVGFFGRMKLAEIGPRDLRAYVAHVAATGVSRNTIRLRLAPVKALLATAHEDELIVANPAAGLRNLLPADDVDATDEEHVRALDSAQLMAVLNELPERWRLFFETLAETGMRVGELIELRFRDLENLDLDLGPRWLIVQRRFYRGRVARPKGRKTRRLRLTRELAEGLRAERDRRDAGDDDLVFIADQGGRIATSNLARRVLKPAAVRAGLGRMVKSNAESWVSFHTFRHTCATGLIRDEGWSLEHVQDYLGHSSYEITRKFYVHLLPDDQPERRSVRLRGDSKVVAPPAEILRNREGG